MLGYLLTLGWITLAGLIINFSSAVLVKRQSYDPTRVSAPPLSELSTNILNIVSLGKRPLIDDFMHLWMLQYLGSEDLSHYDSTEITRAIKQVTKHQIRIESFYMLSCIVQFKAFKTPENCEDIIISGLKAFPRSWRLPMMQGYVFALELERPARAAFYFSIAASRPNSPAYVERVAKKLLDKNELTEKELRFLSESMLDVPGAEFFKTFIHDRYNSESDQQGLHHD